MRYEFKNLTTGRVCCTGDSGAKPPRLCPSCLAQFEATVANNTIANRNASLVAAAAPAPSDVPAPPSLAAAVSARRGQSAPTVPAPHFLSIGPRPRPTVARAAETIDDPPSLVDALRNGRVR